MSPLGAALLWLIGGWMIWLDRGSLRRGRKDAAFYWIVVACGLLLTLTLVLDPAAPGPTKWVDSLFGPAGRFLTP